MKRSVFIVVLVISVLATFAQNKTQVGVYSEGGLFRPDEVTGNLFTQKNGFGFGGGVYVSTCVWGDLSASLGVGYRYKFNRQEEVTPEGQYYWYNPYGYSPYGYGSGTDYTYETPARRYNFPQSYLVVPFKLEYSFFHLVFLESGAEASWLLNYKNVKEKPEFDWVVGIGCDKYRLQFAVEYVQGFKKQGFWDVQDYPELGEFFRNRMFVLNLSYPFWKSK